MQTHVQLVAQLLLPLKFPPLEVGKHTLEAVYYPVFRAIFDEGVVHRILLLVVEVVDEDGCGYGQYVPEEHESEVNSIELVARRKDCRSGC